MLSIFQHDELPRSDHFLVAFYFAFAIFAARYFLDKFVYRRLSMRLLCGRTRRKNDEAVNAKITKCSESMWKFTYFATIEFVTLASIYREPFFRDANELSRNWPNHNDLKTSLKLIYMCQCGFYIYSVVALLMWETRRKDFSISLSHHVVTVLLIAGSYMLRIFRAGVMMLVLHDASDVFLEAAKVFKYSEVEFGASLCFGLFALSWLLLRLIYFPFWIIRQTSYQAIKEVDMSVRFHQIMYYVFNTMLLTLLIFHVYWWKLICAMIARQVKSRGKVDEDIRSDDEGDD